MDSRLVKASSELHHSVVTRGDKMKDDERKALYDEICKLIKMVVDLLRGEGSDGSPNNTYQLSVDMNSGILMTHYDPANSFMRYTPVAYDADKNYSTVWVLTPVSTGSSNFYLRSYVAVGAKMILTPINNGEDYVVEFQQTSDPEYQVIRTESNNKYTFSINNVSKSGGGTTTVYLVPDTDPNYYIKGVTSDADANVWIMDPITVPLT